MERNYSHRTLIQKLGIKSGQTILVIHAPQTYKKELGRLPRNIIFDERGFEEINNQNTQYDFIQLFIQSQERLQEVFPLTKRLLKKTGMLWICWQKGHCTIQSNVNENIIREFVLPNDLVDVKVISINNQWSGLKFVYRLSYRSKMQPQ